MKAALAALLFVLCDQKDLSQKPFTQEIYVHV